MNITSVSYTHLDVYKRQTMARSSRYLVVCLKNDGYDVSLEKRKIYVAIPDASAAKHGLVRVFDESGEDVYKRQVLGTRF